MGKKQFQVGDLVRLKSGGPRMTVTGFEQAHPGYVGCAYFDGGTIKTAVLHGDTVVATSPIEDNSLAGRGDGMVVLFEIFTLRGRPGSATNTDLYREVAEFATKVGPRLVTISGTPWSEGPKTYGEGDVVVWYWGEPNEPKE